MLNIEQKRRYKFKKKLKTQVRGDGPFLQRGFDASLQRGGKKT